MRFLDSGIARYLLDVASPEQLRQHPLRGAIFESWLARKNHHIRGASLGLQYDKAFASLTNTPSIRSVAE